ncbi:MAG: carbonic anhydrase [Burkholderiales bacterium]
MKSVEIVYRYDHDLASERTRPTDAGDAMRRLDEGSRSLAALLRDGDDGRRVIPVDPRDLGLSDAGAPAQRPFAAVLGCSDARVPVELVFNVGPNDLFVVRVAGNGLGAEGLGSLRYAADHFADTLRLVVVLGHSGCGAVSAAVDAFLDPRSYLELAQMHALRNIVDRLLVVVHAAARRLADAHGPDVAKRAGYRAALLEVSIVSNAALGAHMLQRELGHGSLRTAYGVWLLESRSVWAPRHDDPSCEGLAYPPSDGEAFERFADAAVRSHRIASLLGLGEESS